MEGVGTIRKHVNNPFGGAVFVHCAAGISRSATVVVAFMMEHGHQSFEDALDAVRQARPQVHPNRGFQSLLMRNANQICPALRMDSPVSEGTNPFLSASHVRDEGTG